MTSMSIDLQAILKRNDVPADVKAAIGRHLEQGGTDEDLDRAPFRALGAFLRAGLLVEDERGHIRYVNERLVRLSGSSADALEGRVLQTLLDGNVDSPGDSFGERGIGQPHEALLRRESGPPIPVTLMVFPLYAPEGRYQGRFIVVVQRAQAPTNPSRTLEKRPSSDPADNDRLELLSPREREILNELLAGRRVNDVASRLDISRHTVRNHLKAIYRKLGVHSQVELIGRFWPSTTPNPGH